MAGRKMLLRVLQWTLVKYVAATARVTPQAVSAWASGRSTPRLRARLVLEERYRIPREAWD